MGNRLYVGNLPFSADEDSVRQLFGENNRTVTEVKLITDRDTGRPRGVGFVEMASQEDADAMSRAYRAGEMGYGASKGLLQAAMASYFEPYRDRRHELEGDLDYVEDVLQQGAKRAREEARLTLDLAREYVGLAARIATGAAR